MSHAVGMTIAVPIAVATAITGAIHMSRKDALSPVRPLLVSA